MVGNRARARGGMNQSMNGVEKDCCSSTVCTGGVFIVLFGRWMVSNMDVECVVVVVVVVVAE
jgi:hypothetical protein